MATGMSLHLAPTQRSELQADMRNRNLPASVAQRMRLVLLPDEGCSYNEISEQLHVSASAISRWKRRFYQDGILGLGTVHPGQRSFHLTRDPRSLLRSTKAGLDRIGQTFVFRQHFALSASSLG